MARNASAPLVVGLALLFGVTVGAIGMMGLRGGDGPSASAPRPATQVMGAAPASAVVTALAADNCDVDPVLPETGRRDGQYSLQPKPDTAARSEVARLILRGKEAEAGRRQHDAEVSFLNACHKAAVLDDRDRMPLADAMYQLGRLYANAGALGSPQATLLFRRAERLYSASLQAYRAHYGDKAEKTRFAREGLATVQLATGGKAPVATAQAVPAAGVPAPAASGPAASQAVAAAPVATAPVLTAKAGSAQVAAATPTSAPVQAWPPQPRSTMPGSQREQAVRDDTPSVARNERRPDTRAAGAGPAPHRMHRRTRTPHPRHAIVLPPDDATGAAGAQGGDRWQR